MRYFVPPGRFVRVEVDESFDFTDLPAKFNNIRILPAPGHLDPAERGRLEVKFPVQPTPVTGGDA